MKKKYIKYFAVFMMGMGSLYSCKKSSLELTPKGQFSEENYYSTPDQAFTGLVAAYSALNTQTGGIDNTYADPLGALNSASDDCYAGGGSSSDMTTWQAVSNYSMLTPATGPQGEFWAINYAGINRCNLFLSKIPNVQGLTADLQKRYVAESKFLRAHYYFDLVRIFRNIPLITAPFPANDLNSLYTTGQAKPEDVYAQVEKDLTEAMPDLPVTISGSELGRATQGSAKALFGKVLLYEKKYTAAAAQFADVNGTPGGTSKYGYKLMDTYGSIFSPDNKFNSESIFEIARTGTQSYSWGNWNQFKSSVYTQMVGPRSYTGPIYWGGWGFNPVTLNLVNAIKGDPRYPYTAANIDSLTKATKSAYSPGFDNTGYFIQKFAPLLKYKSATGAAELNFPNDYIEMRLADTYLMEAEAIVMGGGDASRAAALLNAVRARVKLAPVAATIANIQNERRLELATEGHRWFDLVRWGLAPTALAFKHFQANKNEILPIPLTELNNTKLVQNPGY
jgi:hypothetical protein